MVSLCATRVFWLCCFTIAVSRVNGQCLGVECNFGTCVGENGETDCVCDTGYTGVYCEESLVSCEEYSEGGYEWPSTPAGGLATVECSSSGSVNLEGTINRVCSVLGSWGELDLSTCSNPVFEMVEEQLGNLNLSDPGSISVENGAMLATSLVEATAPPPDDAIGAFISPSNLNRAVDSLRLLQRSIHEKTGGQRDEAIAMFGSKWFTTCSNVLDSRNLASYMSPSVDALSLTNTLVDSLDGISGDYGGYVTSETRIVEPNLLVIGGPIETPSQGGVAVFPSNTSSAGGESIRINSDTIDSLKVLLNKQEVKLGMVVSHELGGIIKIVMSKGKTGARPASKFVTLGVAEQRGKVELSSPVSISFKQSAEDSSLVNSGAYTRNCGYWNTALGKWGTDGLTGYQDTSGHYECVTSHFTSFSVLIKPNPIGNDTSTTEQLALSIVTYILCSISLIALIASIVVFLLLGKELIKKDLYIVHLNFAISLSIALLLFIFGVETAKDNVVVCGVVAGILHYSFLSVFSWSFCEAIQVLYMLYALFSPRRIFVYLMVLGWGLPLPVVAVTAGIRWYNYGVAGEYCWLSTENGTVWSFIGPALTIVFINLFLMVIAVVRIISGMRAKLQEMPRFRQARVVAFGTLVLVPVLGIPWIVAVLNFFVSVSLFQWIFVILNTPQGLMFFLLYVLNNRDMLKKLTSRKMVSERDRSRTTEKSRLDYSPNRSIAKFKKRSTCSIVNSEACVTETPMQETIPEFPAVEETCVVTEGNFGMQNPAFSIEA